MEGARQTEIANFWSKTLKTPSIWSSLRALTASQLSPKQLLNCVGAAGSKLTPGLQEPAAAKPAKINQPPPQFLTKLLGETRDQQASAGLIYRPNSVQGTPTLLTLQPKTHAAAAGILTKIFAGQIQSRTPSSQPPSWPILNPRTQSRGPQPYAKPYNRQALPTPTKARTLAKAYNQIRPSSRLSPTHKPRSSPIRTGIIDKNLRP